jgi:glycosyltransferase involved in cell wall biosynthesis
MNKILMVTTVPGTLRSFLLPFAAHFRRLGWQVDAMACDATASIECQQGFDRVWDVEWSRNPLDPRNLLAAPGVIREIVARERYDLVHVHTPVAAFVTRYALKDLRRQTNTKIVYTAHGFHFYPGGKPIKNAAFIALEKLAGNWTDYLVTINREDEAAVVRHGLVPPARSRYMPGIGVDLAYYNAAMVTEAEVVALDRELGIDRQTPLLLAVAEFTARKQHRTLIEAFAKLQRPQVHLALAGSGPLLEPMQQLAADLGASDRIHFLGNRKDIPTLMRAAVANILVSAQEGLPRSVLESLALGLPTIGTKIRGTQDLLADGCGLLVDVGDVDGLTSAMTQILDRPELATAISHSGRERIGGFDLQIIIDLHEKLYSEAIAG